MMDCPVCDKLSKLPFFAFPPFSLQLAVMLPVARVRAIVLFALRNTVFSLGDNTTVEEEEEEHRREGGAAVCCCALVARMFHAEKSILLFFLDRDVAL